MKGISVVKKGGFRDFSGTMTDISFLLIVFFLITAAFVTDRGLFLTLPDPDSGPLELLPERVVVIAVGAADYSVDGAPVADAGLLPALTRSIRAKRPDAVILEVAHGVQYSRVLSTLEAAKASGGETFSISTGNEPVPVELQGPPL